LHRLLIFIVFLFSSPTIFSQDKIGLDHRLAPVKKGEAAIYFLSYSLNEDGSYEVQFYYPNDQLLMQGNSMDSLGQILEGMTTWYYKNGNIQSEGAYKNGQKQGTWKRYNEDGSAKADRHYSAVSMNNIVFNSALYMPKPLIEQKNFDSYIKDKVMENRLFDLIPYSPIKIQLIISNEGLVVDKKFDDRLSNEEMQKLNAFIDEIPAWKAGSNGTQNINVRVDYLIDLTTD
jgi:hypothetical protein